MPRRLLSTRQQDREVLRRLLSNAPGAWREFVRDNGRFIQAVIRRTLASARAASGGLDADVADVTGNLFLQLVAQDMRKLKLFDETKGMSLRGFVAMLAANAAVDHARSQRRTRKLIDAVGRIETGISDVDPRDALERKQQQSMLDEALDQLTDAERQFVHQLCLREVEAQQLAQAMKIKLNTVYSRKHKLISRLKLEVNRQDGRTV
jgi:RNA polymerase sigma-70 factor, ECF subfamily